MEAIIISVLVALMPTAGYILYNQYKLKDIAARLLETEGQIDGIKEQHAKDKLEANREVFKEVRKLHDAAINLKLEISNLSLAHEYLTSAAVDYKSHMEHTQRQIEKRVDDVHTNVRTLFNKCPCPADLNLVVNPSSSSGRTPPES